MARLLGGDAGKERRRWRESADRETRQGRGKDQEQAENMGVSMFTSRRFGKGGCGRDGHGHRVKWVGGFRRRVDGWMSPEEGTLQVQSAPPAVRPGPEDSL